MEEVGVFLLLGCGAPLHVYVEKVRQQCQTDVKPIIELEDELEGIVMWEGWLYEIPPKKIVIMGAHFRFSNSADPSPRSLMRYR